MPEWKPEILRRLTPLKLAPMREAEIAEEIAQHLEDRYQELLATGQSEDAAFRTAIDELKGEDFLTRSLQRVEKNFYREPIVPGKESTHFFSGVLQDIRYALRMLRKSPGFTALAVLTLALGIGVNTAIFSVVDTLALRPIPYQDPSRLVSIGSVDNATGEQWVSMLDFVGLRDRAQSFSLMAGISPVWSNVITVKGTAQQAQSLYVSAAFFPLLGVRPFVGRFFTREEDRYGAGAHVVVLSYAYWQSEFGGDRALVGKTVNIDGVAFTVIGVTPQNFLYLGEPVAGTSAHISLWMPLATNQIAGTPRYVRFLKVIAKLKPVVPFKQAATELRTIGSELSKQYADADGGLKYIVGPLSEQVTGPVRPAMLLLLGAVGLVLLMACMNVANLLLARGMARARDIAVRAALGASHFRLLRQFLTESCALAGLGMLFGVVLAYALLQFLIAAAPAALLEGRTIALDSRVMAFTLGAAAVSALLAGFPPAWRILRRDIANDLHESGYGFTTGHRRFRAGLVVGQMSLALALLIGAGLLMRSFVRLLDVNPGFDPEHLATVSALLPPGINTVQQALLMDTALIDRISQIPGVRAVGAVSRLPLLGSHLGSWIWIDGKTYPQGKQPSVEYRVASPGYFTAMRIPLLAGRYFNDQDIAGAAARVAIVDQAAAEAYWPGKNAVGQRIKVGPNPEKQDWINVVGVIANVHQFGLDKEPEPEVYRPMAYSALGNPALVARVNGSATSALRPMADAVRSVAGGMPAYNAFAMTALVERSTVQRRFIMLLLVGFAIAALLLAAVGIYGTMSQSVAQRTRELGLRIALGAPRHRVLRMILLEGLRLALAGAAFGGITAALLTRLMHAVLFEVGPLDPGVFAGAAGTLMVVAIIACLVPAYRATRVDPMVALRYE